MIFQPHSASFELRRGRRSVQVIGKQQTPRFASVHRDANIPLIEEDTVPLVGGLHPAVLKPVGHYQDQPLRLVAYELAWLTQQPLQDCLPFQVFHLPPIEFLYVGAERLPFPSLGRRAFVLPAPFGKRQLLAFEKTSPTSEKFPRKTGDAKRKPLV